MADHQRVAMPVAQKEPAAHRPCACTMGGALFVAHVYVMMQPYTEGSKVALVAVDETMSAYVALKPYECCICHTSYTAEEVKAFGVALVQAP